jgi:hypothetical protein
MVLMCQSQEFERWSHRVCVGSQSSSPFLILEASAIPGQASSGVEEWEHGVDFDARDAPAYHLIEAAASLPSAPSSLRPIFRSMPPWQQPARILLMQLARGEVVAPA